MRRWTCTKYQKYKKKPNYFNQIVYILVFTFDRSINIPEYNNFVANRVYLLLLLLLLKITFS